MLNILMSYLKVEHIIVIFLVSWSRCSLTVIKRAVFFVLVYRLGFVFM